VPRSRPVSTRSTRNSRNGLAPSTARPAARDRRRPGRRVDARRQVGDRDLEVVLLLPLVEALGGRLSGGVGVEGEHRACGRSVGGASRGRW
jgi:hypothetical protein